MRSVARIVRSMGYSLRVNRKTIAPNTHPRRYEQFRHIAALRSALNPAIPAVSVDAKKKELVGRFRNPGMAWSDASVDVFDHDYPSWATGKATPYGVYDLQSNTGWVGLGLSHDTPYFAVDCIEAWWLAEGRERYRDASELLVLADSGGSNGINPHAWKHAIQQRLCNRHNLTGTVAHYPSGCSKFNPIEHRLSSEISKNWAGVPLQSVETILNYIRTTTTESGLTVSAELMEAEYQTGLKITAEQLADLNLTRHDPLPRLNYTIAPNSS